MYGNLSIYSRLEGLLEDLGNALQTLTGTVGDTAQNVVASLLGGLDLSNISGANGKNGLEGLQNLFGNVPVVNGLLGNLVQSLLGGSGGLPVVGNLLGGGGVPVLGSLL